MKITQMVAMIVLAVSASAFAANGDLIVNGKVGIGTTSPQNNLEISGMNALSSLRLDAVGSNGYVFETTGAPTYGLQLTYKNPTNIFSNLMYFDYHGNVGIGTTSPAYKLDVNGNSAFRASTYVYNSILYAFESATGKYLHFKTNGGVGYVGMDDSSSLVLQTNGGNVGIGTASPHDRVHVLGGGLRISHGAYGANGFVFEQDGTSGHLYMRYKSPTDTYAEIMTLGYGGNVGIGTMSPEYKLDVAGQARINGTVYPSDIRLKKDVQPLSDSLNVVLNLQGVSYKWRTDEYKEKNLPEGRHYGVIAQEIEKVLPEVISTAPDGTKAVAYTEIIPVLIEAIKEQQRRIEHLEKIIADN